MTLQQFRLAVKRAKFVMVCGESGPAVIVAKREAVKWAVIGIKQHKDAPTFLDAPRAQINSDVSMVSISVGNLRGEEIV